MVWEARQVAGSLAVLPSAQVLQLMYELLLVLCQQEPPPPCPQAWAMAYAAREESCSRGVLLRGWRVCGRSAIRPVLDGTTGVGGSGSAAGCSGLTTESSDGTVSRGVTRPEWPSAVHSCPFLSLLPHPHLPAPGGQEQDPLLLILRRRVLYSGRE